MGVVGGGKWKHLVRPRVGPVGTMMEELGTGAQVTGNSPGDIRGHQRSRPQVGAGRLVAPMADHNGGVSIHGHPI